MPIEILMPKIGLNMREGLLVEWLVKEGAQVQAGQPLYVVETDKVTNEVLAEAGGIIHQLVPAGEVVPVSSVVGYILSEGETVPGLGGVTSKDSRDIEADISIPLSAVRAGKEKQKIIASPAAKKRAKELDVDLSAVTGTNPDGSISVKDVENFASMSNKSTPSAKTNATPVAKKLAKELGVDLHKLRPISGGRITREDVERAYAEMEKQSVDTQHLPLKGIRRTIAERMYTSSSQTAPVTLFTETNAENMAAVRSMLDNSSVPGVSYNALFVRLTALALKDHSYINARLEEGVIHRLKEINIGVAVDTERGLMVPVIHHADEKDVAEIQFELLMKIERAMSGSSTIEDISGGTFTITNLGNLGVDGFTPIINLPEIAILGIGRIVQKVVPINGLIGIQKRMVLSLTFDHRLVDGAPAAKFLQKISTLVSECSLALLQ